MEPSKSSSYGQLEKLIIHHLAEGRAYTAKQLQQRIASQRRSYSIQAIYYVLRKLRTRGVVITVAGQFSLSLAWALDLLDLARRIEHRVFSSIPATQIIPSEGMTLSWRFSSLMALDDFWIHLILLTLGHTSTDRIYNFCPHPWFFFLHQPRLAAFYEVLRRRNARIFVVIGGDEYLDRFFSQSVNSDLYRCIHTCGKGVGGAIHRHVMVIGDFVIEVVLPRRWASELDAMFREVSGTSYHEIQPLQQLFQIPGSLLFRVTNHTARAHRLTRSFRELFSEG